MMKISKLSIVVYFVVIVAAIRFSIVGIDCWKNYKNQQIVKETIIPNAKKHFSICFVNCGIYLKCMNMLDNQINNEVKL